MNTHDIELPPLPEWADTTLQGEDRDSLLAWAEAAIEADRQCRGEPVAWLQVDANGRVLATALEPGQMYKSEYDEGAKDVPLYSAPQPAEPVSLHPDDAAVDAFAAEMKAKLAKKRADGRAGWQECTSEYLSGLLREHVEKGDPLDVANLAMMLHQTGQRIVPTKPVKVPSDAPAALRFAARVVELYDDATIDDDYMIDSGDCAGILNALADYFSRHSQPAQPAASVEPVAKVTTGTSWGPGLAFIGNGKPAPKPGTLLYAAPVAAQPSVPEPLKYGGQWKDHYVTGWNNCCAVMLAAVQPNPDPTHEEEEQWRQMEAAQARADRIFDAASK